MADASVGEVDITLDGKIVTLRCSLGAAKRVNELAGGNGYVGLLGRLATYDFTIYVALVAAAQEKRLVDVESAVYNTGLPSLTAGLSLYVTNLANGGKPITAAKDGSESGEA